MKKLGDVTYQVQQFHQSAEGGMRAHWEDKLATKDGERAYALASSLGRSRVHEFETVKLRGGKLAVRERKGSPFTPEEKLCQIGA